jgi:hypothetical protein
MDFPALSMYRGRSRLRLLLVAGQVALGFVLLFGRRDASSASVKSRHAINGILIAEKTGVVAR